MSLAWTICSFVASFEAGVLLMLSIPMVHVIRSKTIPLLDKFLQPLLFVVPFGLFQLLDVIWKYEFEMPPCSEPGCTPMDHERFQRKACRNERNLLLSLSVVFFYWLLYRMTKIHVSVLKMEAEAKKRKD
eukprot:TRINITY_DN33292_c0_g1_i1.p1 TRINITY_DN33292_c0_g1~~TRINITY_DN33292_c0_g1_i1.p1  ORF type:complete len:130 (-),score=16.52 TRINITY_DN33292_c0_g1_i1:270-659(-)